MRTIQTTLYTFDELSDRAKERAREWFRERLDFDAEYVIEDAATIAAFMGWDIRQTRKTRMDKSHYYEPTVYWSGFWSQGDGACFKGAWRASDVDAAALRQHAPQDAELHRIAARIESIAQACPDASASVKHRGHYYHEGCTDFECDGFAPEYEDDETRSRDEWAAIDARASELEDELKDEARNLMRWIYRQLEREYEYRNSDECVDEDIRANEYEFDEDGVRA